MADTFEDADDFGHKADDHGAFLKAGKDDGYSRHTLLTIVLRRELGANFARFKTAPSLLVMVRVPTKDWADPVHRAIPLMAKFQQLNMSDSRSKDVYLRDAMQRLAGGNRVLCIDVAGAVPPALMAAADIVLNLGRLTRADIVKAIKLATGSFPRGLTEADCLGVDLLQAIGAIRPGSTPASCVRRIRAGKKSTALDPYVSAAPELKDLHGYGAAAEWGESLVADLDLWRNGAIAMSDIQRNIVLSGPPGTGKSTFVRSVAKSTGLPLVTTSLGQMFSSSQGHLDSIVKQIDAVFSAAADAGPAAIVLFDELEAFPNRGALSAREASWWTPVVNHMLTRLDSGLAEGTSNLVIIGATNHADRLDPALIRPGRFDRVIEVGIPDVTALEGIYRQHLGTDLPGEDLSGIAEMAAGSTGADAAGHVKGARARARALGHPLQLADLVAEICPPSPLDPNDLYRACVHESGHAIVGIELEVGEILSVTVSGQGGHVTYKAERPPLEDAQASRDYATLLLAGRAAEQVVFGMPSSGAGGALDSDLARATAAIAAAYTSFGLRDTLAFISEPEEAVNVIRRSPSLLAAVEKELREAYGRAISIVERNRFSLFTLAGLLRDDRVLSGDRVRTVMKETARDPTGGLDG